MENTKVHDVIAIADEFLRIAKGLDQVMSPMKLTKLIYIAHGWFLAIHDQRLIRNRIEAWKYGPVIPDLYHATKSFGSNDIPLDRIGRSEESSVDSDIRKFLERVYDVYGHLTAIQLSNLTHRKGTPWEQVFKPEFLGIEITNKLIKDYYKGLLDG